MKKQRPTKRMSDAQLKKLLASSRQDVAAPTDFAAKVTQRLRAEGLIKGEEGVGAGFKPAQTNWLPRLAWGMAGALGLVVALRMGAGLKPAPTQPMNAAQSATTDAPAPMVANAGDRAPAREKAVPSANVPAPMLANAGARVGAGFKPAHETAAPVPTVAPVSDAPAPAVVAETVVAAETRVTIETRAGLKPAPTRSAPMIEAPSFGSSGGPVPGSAPGSSAATVRPAGLGGATPSPTPQVTLAVTETIAAGSVVKGNVVRLSRGDQAVIELRLGKPGYTKVEVYTRNGARVDTLLDRDLPAGVHTLRFNGLKADGSSLPSGIYLLQIQTPEFRKQHKVALVR